MTPTVGVIAAGGHTGRSIVRALADRGLQTRGLVRSARSAEAARQDGASETAHIELAERTSIAKAITGLDTLVFIAPPFDAQEEVYAANALAVARTQGVDRFIYYSVLHASFPDVPHHRRKLNVETHVQDSPLRWTIIQPTMYQQTLLEFISRATDGVVRLPYSRTTPFHLVDLADVAQVVARVVAETDDHLDASYELAGPEGMSTVEMVERVAQVTGRRLCVEEVPFSSLPLPPGLSRTVIAEMMAMFAKYDRSGYPANANVLRSLLGREPTALATTARRELASSQDDTGRAMGAGDLAPRN